MSPAVKYTLGRLVLFVACFAAAWFIPGIDLFIKLGIAVLASFALSWFLLRGLRDEMTAQVEDALERRKADKERLRAALAGEDAPAAAAAETDEAGEAAQADDTAPVAEASSAK
ncbi:hypothetical protein CS0771_16000 [Catellatospora sp. IY07-71]|uniref:DUF4229 domain-containing protein n=1 Tax=Catellatospora sp. IY07-71 TaxID=2728827 RepID=UPI001BB45E89|nr:DUF4229 domain-containing protein [Catellatospora sp. IY07-71]BCJ72056.1 hypothetical protein CS0771_16000 [Catellatospora sp. IY07-71]